jgi:hypothetical protein
MHSTGDKLAAGVMLTFAIVARLRCGVHPTAAEEWHSAAVLLLSIAVMLSADDVSEHQLFGTRSVLVTLLKLAASTAPLFKNFSLAMSQASTCLRGHMLDAAAMAGGRKGRAGERRRHIERALGGLAGCSWQLLCMQDATHCTAQAA